ncbi:hypothetical protein AJ88_31215 [Mesorhizobium amorphae CCBAU 01583]|nr:hypothetical protein AJ88_31215 [Mesorhizobium amorphae CCBAU 01583]
MTVMRPSGKMTSGSPPCTILISVRVDIGLAGLSGRARASFMNGFIHQAWAIVWSMAKTGSSSVSVSASGPSRKLTWLSARIGAGPAALRLSSPSTSR